MSDAVQWLPEDEKLADLLRSEFSLPLLTRVLVEQIGEARLSHAIAASIHANVEATVQNIDSPVLRLAASGLAGPIADALTKTAVQKVLGNAG